MVLRTVGGTILRLKEEVGFWGFNLGVLMKEALGEMCVGPTPFVWEE